MSNSSLNTGKRLIERSETVETKRIIDEKIDWFASTLNGMGLTDRYIREALGRISYATDEVELDEALVREQVKAEMVVNKKKKTGKEAEETGDGKSSEDAEGKGPILNTPVDTGNARATLDDKKRGKTMEHLEALFSGEELTDSFRRKAAAIFEAAVNSRVEEIQTELVRQSRDVVVEEVLGVKSQLTNQLDEYMNYVVSEWMSENELAIDRGVQNEISESFMNGLRGLFESHYIEVPESKVDLVETLTSKCQELTGKLNNTLHENVQLSKETVQSNCETIFESMCHGLAATEVEKFKALARGVEYNSEAEFSDKLSVIKESYFNNNVAYHAPMVLNETVDVPSYDETEGLSGRMSAYFNTIGHHADVDENNTQS